MGPKDYKSKYWSIPFTKVKFGAHTLKTIATLVVLDSGCTVHYARKSFIDQLVQRSDGLKGCNRFKENLICQCSRQTFDNLPSLEVVAKEGSIYLDKDHYAQFRDIRGLQYCAIMIQELPPWWKKDLIIFGLQFFRQYFSVFDNSNHSVGLIPYGSLDD